jgi:hypothetical protein
LKVNDPKSSLALRSAVTLDLGAQLLMLRIASPADAEPIEQFFLSRRSVMTRG